MQEKNVTWYKFISSVFFKSVLKIKSYLKLKNDDEVIDFLIDLNIALGYDYERPGRELFPQFLPHFNDDPYLELSLADRLAQAYRLLTVSNKNKAHKIIRTALNHCAKSPLGIKRSLTCLELAHEIEPALITGEVNYNLMFRANNKDELAIWLLQLIHRWQKWNIKVKLNSYDWEKAILAIEPKGMLTLLLYVFDHNLNDQIECCKKLCDIAEERIEIEEDAFFDVGQDPKMLQIQIRKLKRRIRNYIINDPFESKYDAGTISGLNYLEASVG